MCDLFVCLYDFVCILIFLVEKEVWSGGENGNYGKKIVDMLVKEIKMICLGLVFDLM